MFLWTFNEFNTPYVLFGQSPPSAADLISLHIYVNSFIDLNFGLGAAMSVLLLLFLWSRRSSICASCGSEGAANA